MKQGQPEQGQRTRAEELSRRLPGREAIYREMGIVVRIRVRDVTVDDWGVKIGADVLPTQGLPGPPVLDFSGAWQVLGVGSSSIYAAYVGWSLYSDPALVADIVTFAETLSGESNHYLELSRRITVWEWTSDSL